MGCKEAPAPPSATSRAEAICCLRACRIHYRVSSQALGVLSLNLIAPASDATPPNAAKGPDSVDAGAAPEAASKVHLSPLGAAVKAAVASLVPACVALPLTVPMVRN